MITLLADSAYQEWWGGPFPPGLYMLIALGGLVTAAVVIIIDIVRWFRSGEASFWWRWHMGKPRDRR